MCLTVSGSAHAGFTDYWSENKNKCVTVSKLMWIRVVRGPSAVDISGQQHNSWFLSYPPPLSANLRRFVQNNDAAGNSSSSESTALGARCPSRDHERDNETRSWSTQFINQVSINVILHMSPSSAKCYQYN